MSKLSLLPLLLILFFPALICAQSQLQVVTPEPPFLALMPDNSTWTIDVTNPATSAKLPPGAKAVDQFITSKSGTNREIISIWTDGSKSYVWLWEGYRLEQNPGSTVVLVTQIPGGHESQNNDFSNLTWLEKGNYVGAENQGGHACHHFKTEVKIETLHAIVEYSAYIDAKTKRPVVWDVGSNHFELTSFAMRKADDPLTLPEAFAAQLKAYRVAAQAANPYKKQ